MKIVAIIPARMDSTRFPGKPLAKILGITMIEHVYRRTAMCLSLDSVYVATCDQEICDVVEEFGGKAIMTAASHQRASDRVAEAAEHLDADIVVMVQGDEPMTMPDMIDLAVSPMLEDSTIQCVNLAKRIESIEEFKNPNTIKLVKDRHGNALYFSREAIPTREIQDFEKLPVFKQVCIIPFKKNILLEYAALEPTPLEKAESVDMLRLLEHGLDVFIVETKDTTYAVDTNSDLQLVEKLMRCDPLVKEYL